jgi:hypothetical protein
MYDRRGFLLLAALLIGVAPAQAQEKYPTRPIKLLVPFPAGGPVDVMGRLIGQRLSLTLGQQVIIENRPGAGSTLAARAAATADPDGYTLLVGSAASLAIGPALYKNIGYDPATSFAPVALVSSVPCDDRGAESPGADRARARRLRQSQSGQAQHRRSQWRAAAHDRGVVSFHDPHRRRDRAL